MYKSKRAFFVGWANERATSTRLMDTINNVFELVSFRFFPTNIGSHITQAIIEKRPDFLFSFSPYIVPPEALEACGFAINFHTAPPEYRGRGGCSWALYNGDGQYGVTAHLMTPDIDAGQIIKVIRFLIEGGETVESLHERTLDYIPLLARSVIDDIVNNDYQPCPDRYKERWGAKLYTQKDLDNLLQIQLTDNEMEVERKIRATRHSQKKGVYLQFRGHTFRHEESLACLSVPHGKHGKSGEDS